jgi:hypothetical protein
MELTLILIVAIALDAFLQLLRLGLEKSIETKFRLFAKSFDSPDYVNERPMVFSELKSFVMRQLEASDRHVSGLHATTREELGELAQSLGQAIGELNNKIAAVNKGINVLMEPVLEAEAQKAAKKLAGEIEFDLFRPPMAESCFPVVAPTPAKKPRKKAKARRSRR